MTSIMSRIIADIAGAPSREAAQSAALIYTKAWVNHWDGDRKCGLAITEQSVADCLAIIGAAQSWRAPVSHTLSQHPTTAEA